MSTARKAVQAITNPPTVTPGYGEHDIVLPKPYLANPFAPPQVRNITGDAGPPATPRPSIEPEIRAIAERLRHLAATDNDAGRHIEEYLGGVIPRLALDAEHIEDLKRELKSAEDFRREETSEKEDAHDLVEKWEKMYAELSEPLTPEEMEDPENVACFMAAFREWNEKAGELYHS